MDDDDGSISSSASGSTYGVDDDSGSDDGSALPATCPEGPAPSMNPQGILGHYPSQTWMLGSPTLVPISVNYVVTEDGDSRGPLLEMWVEVRNDGDTECYLLPEVFIDGEEIIGLVTSAPFEDGISGVTVECIGPGGIGVYGGLARGIFEADLEASTVSFNPLPNTFFDATPALAPTLTDQGVALLDDDSVGFTATLRPDRDIHNYKLSVYPRDAHGLVFDELLAFPNELDTLSADSTWPVETLGAPCSFDDHHLYQSWIEGARSDLLDTDDSDRAAQRQRRSQRLRMREIRG